MAWTPLPTAGDALRFRESGLFTFPACVRSAQKAGPGHPRPACTEGLARTLWPAALSFEAEQLSYWRKLIEDDAHQYPDFPVVLNPLLHEAIWQAWDVAACCAMLFDEFHCTIQAAGRDVTPDLLRDWSASSPLR